MPFVIKGQGKGPLAYALAAATALMCALPASAGANVTPLDTTIQYTDASRSTCDGAEWPYPYRSIGDSRTYVLAPAGSFTGATAPGWQFRGGARIVNDAARGPALALPAGRLSRRL